MTKTVISVENLSKSYRLGQIGTGTLSRDLEVWWAKVRGKPNPLLKIGQTDHGNQDGQTLWALRDVSFQVQQGEVLGIIGRNGAGKSTLLKILSRVTAPTSGQIKVKGRIASLLEVGTGFHPELTGRENIFLNGAILGMSKQEVQRKFDEIVSFAEVEKFVDTPVKRYSSGMYVRLAFAVAAHLESEIMLIDEVLAVGDAGFQKKSFGKMGEVVKNGRTILLVSHNLASIKSLCEKCLYLASGNLKQIGISSEVIDFYLNSNEESIEKLIYRKDRTGTGEIKFSEINILDFKDRTPKINFLTGDTIQIELIIDSLLDQEIYIGLQLKDPFGNNITSFNTRESGFLPKINKGLNKICLTIPSIMLLEGTYSISGSIVKYHNAMACDRIENIGTIIIHPRDIFKTNAPFRAMHGNFLLVHTWQGPNDEYLEIKTDGLMN